MSYKNKSRAGFTLVELLVSLVIVSILAAMTLSGLSAVRRRSREEATRTTIRKIHEIIVPQYESYLDKRISALKMSDEINQLPTITSAARPDCFDASTSTPLARRKFELRKLASIRRTLSLEMPDNWDDVGGLPGPPPGFSNYQSGLTRAYASYEGSTATDQYQGAECLYMICLLSGFQPEAMENFRAEEIGDKDSDGKPEFHDAWGMPIRFIRWPTGFDGPITLNQDTDPFDPDTIDGPSNGVPYGPTSASPPRFLLGTTPLIYSPGLDQEYGWVRGAETWNKLPVSGPSQQSMVNLDRLTFSSTDSRHFAAPDGNGGTEDNISNHDFITR